MNVKGCKIRQTLKKMQLPRYNISWWSHLRLMRLPRYNIKAGGCFLSLMMKKRPNEVMARIYNGKMQIPKSSMALRGAAMAGGACIGRQRATPFVLSSSPLFFRVRSLHSPSHPLLRFTSFPNPKTGFKYQIRAIQEVTADTVKSQKGKEDDEQSSPQNWKIKMLYDGDCPLCMREVMGRIHAILSDGTVVTDVEIAAIADSIYGVWAKYRLQITGRPPLEEVLETRRKKKVRIR
uniref:Uncharacterized protein n=1 Tax=Gossypium raimondii TaxID=29730 RepID=A0A0D2QU88_GOSRA|nr:hypothetical protein B456_003G157900 [Gossypium raimondii]